MKLKFITATAAFFIAASTLVITSCQRERDNDTSEGTETMLFESTNDDVFAIVEQAATGDVSQFKKLRGCATVTNDLVSSPKSITVDFGTSNCLCFDGKKRRGKIITTYTGDFYDKGVRTTTYENYFINDNQLTGIMNVTNLGLNAVNNPTWKIETKDSLIKSNNAGTASWQSTREREMTAGSTTPMWTDDKYTLSGTGSGVKTNGNHWSMNITSPLHIDHNCLYRITSGAMQYQPQGRVLRSLDFGSGSCDNDATITINNKIIAVKF